MKEIQICRFEHSGRFWLNFQSLPLQPPLQTEAQLSWGVKYFPAYLEVRAAPVTQ